MTLTLNVDVRRVSVASSARHFLTIIPTSLKVPHTFPEAAMASSKLSTLPSLRRQNLLIELYVPSGRAHRLIVQWLMIGV